MSALLEVEDLSVAFRSQSGTVRAVDGVSFSVDRGETLGIVGESGSGKSVTALAVMGLVADPPGRITGGRIRFEGQDLRAASPETLRSLRGHGIAMIFQDPMTSLNPVLTIGRQLTEVTEVHLGLSPEQARRRAVELLDMVGIPSPESRLDDYPHRFSGGMRQRVMIAMAMACKPRLIIADEPTTALDVTIQAQILELLRSLQAELGMAMILITHDLGVVAGMADRVCVMYAGRIVEEGPTEAIFDAPGMPYTAGLLGSVPRLDRPDSARLVPIPGLPPAGSQGPGVCSFAPRCGHTMARCLEKAPSLVPVGDARHRAACWLREARP
ncbi:ABC transporter ATP-binding protein [uncultured Alsobacter sp.]|uniref:ABC transporter ATP-binding protein n=1 Tax=uncultured Alsobacter sp. TaxID=1748258 RepID=UPI0025D16BF2|nr:ABC transporter ATP-binding protein [uncultured Alsobacter sp.]